MLKLPGMTPIEAILIKLLAEEFECFGFVKFETVEAMRNAIKAWANGPLMDNPLANSPW